MYQTHTYENGFRLKYEKAPINTIVTSINVICDVGSIHEPENNRGASHFIEHMCFKGTTDLPNSHEISRIFDRTGAYINAYTDRRYTCYYVIGTNANLCEHITTVGDMLLNSKFSKTEYDKEHHVIREEMAKDMDDSEMITLENADKILYAGSPYENQIDMMKYHNGSHQLKHSDVVEIYKQYYVPSRLIMSVCSTNSFAEVKRCVDESPFAKSHKMPINPIMPLILSLNPQNDVQFVLTKKTGISPTFISVGFRTCAITNPDKYALKILKTILSETMDGRLFFLLREENGLSYTSYVSCDYFEHMGDFKIYAECVSNKVFHNNDKKLGTFPLIMKLIRDLLKNGIKSAELKLAKGQLEGKMRIKAEDCENIAKFNGKTALFGLPDMRYSDVYEKKLKPITKKMVDDCIRKYFRKEGMVVSVVSNDDAALKQANYEKHIILA
jgi:predicted Zn-dependent peptidase